MYSEEGKPFFAFYGVTLVTYLDAVAPFQKPDDLREHAAILLSEAIRQSSECLLMTADKRMYRDCAVAARTIFETLVNVLYIMASDESVAQRMVDHANMKMARDLDRTIEAGSARYAVQHALKDSILDDLGFKEIWNKFSDSENREIRDWSKKNIHKRLQVIENAFGTKLTQSLVFPLANYRFASEVIHGTVYSILVSRNIVLTNQTLPLGERVQNVESSILSLLLGQGAAIGHAAKALAKGENADAIRNRIDEINEKFRPEFKKFVERGRWSIQLSARVDRCTSGDRKHNTTKLSIGSKGIRGLTPPFFFGVPRGPMLEESAL